MSQTDDAGANNSQICFERICHSAWPSGAFDAIQLFEGALSFLDSSLRFRIPVFDRNSLAETLIRHMKRHLNCPGPCLRARRSILLRGDLAEG